MTRIVLGLFAFTSFLCASISNPVPEPSTYLMMGAGLGALLYVRKKYGKKQ